MKKILIFSAAIVLFIELLDTTILYSCLIPISNNFGINPSRMSFPILSYITGTCLFIPTVSWLLNKYNKIFIITISLVAFSLFSLFCGLATELYSFTVFRFLQGIAISICGTAIITTVLSVCEGNELVKIMSTINIPALLGTALGPVIGALFSYYLSWRIAFFINLPIGLLIVWFLLKFKSNPFFSRDSFKSIPFDWLGLFLLSGSLIALSIGLEQLSHSVNIINVVVLITGILLALFYLLMWKKRPHQSILNLIVFKNKDFLFGTIVNVIARSSMCGIPVLLSIVLQKTFDFSVIRAGAYLALISISAIFAKLLSWFIEKLGVRKSVVLFSMLTAVAIFLLIPLEWLAKNNYLWVACIFLGFTMSLLYTSMNSVLYLTLNEDEMADASNLGSIIQQFSIGLGVMLAVGGYQFLSSNHFINFSQSISNVFLFQIICCALALLMMINFFVAIPFNFHRKKSLN